MDVEAQKPFACKVKDCGMSFTNEDHLNVHEKKHDMILNLGLTNKAAGAFIADQTPTPTRLIKNCDEVGLFDDLKHVNPFDETFRRAVELKNDTPGLELSSVAESLNRSEDSLHTPQVFPQFDSSDPSTITPASTDSSFHEFRVEKQQLILAENISDKQKRSTVKCKQKKSAEVASKPANILPVPSQSSVKSILVPAINLLPATQIIAFSIPATAVMQRPMLLPKLTADHTLPQIQPELSVKDKLKAHLSSPKIHSTTSRSIDVAQKLDDPSAKQFSTAKIARKHSLKRGSHQVDEDCMERRRAAALRYRRKIKKEQTDLKRKNAELLAENMQLKNLVKQLKEVIWSHQNCPVINLRGEERTAVTIKDVVQPLMNANQIRPPTTTIQIPVATPIKFILQDDNVNSSIKIPVSSIE